MGLARLEESLPGLSNLRLPSRDSVDWDFLERELRLSLPADYKELVESYEPFVISNLLHIFMPKPGFEVGYLDSVRDSLEYLEMDHEAGDTDQLPFSGNGGLFPWGTSSSGDTYYWRVKDGRPTSVVAQDGSHFFWEFPGSMEEFLAGWCSGRIQPVGQPNLADWGGASAVRVDWAS